MITPEAKPSPFKFEDLPIYQEVLSWINEVYSLTTAWPKEEQFGLTGQLRRAAVSIALNISEGSGRTNKDFSHFLSTARGSCYECATFITIAKNQNYVNYQEFEHHYDKCNKIARTLNVLRTSIKS